ncbi:hypothetical protein GCM10009525_47870 [Streptosporangium amethystogenes subsp. fukuiense]
MSDDQVKAYSEFEELPSLADLEKFFFLDAFDRNVIAQSRQDAHRLGVAIQIGTVRYKGLSWRTPWRCLGLWWTTWLCSWGSWIRRR